VSVAYLPWSRPAEFDARPCVRDAEQELTYAEFSGRVDAAAEQLSELGVTPGSVVAIMLPNRVELLVAMMAAWRLGAAATPMNPTFTATEAQHQLSDSGAVVLVTDRTETISGAPTIVPVSELRSEARGAALPEPRTDPADVALLIYTSGSTGRPKGVVLNHGNIGRWPR
jgi:long-chain acyl-CoA synthetase